MSSIFNDPFFTMGTPFAFLNAFFEEAYRQAYKDASEKLETKNNESDDYPEVEEVNENKPNESETNCEKDCGCTCSDCSKDADECPCECKEEGLISIADDENESPIEHRISDLLFREKDDDFFGRKEEEVFGLTPDKKNYELSVFVGNADNKDIEFIVDNDARQIRINYSYEVKEERKNSKSVSKYSSRHTFPVPDDSDLDRTEVKRDGEFLTVLLPIKPKDDEPLPSARKIEIK